MSFGDTARSLARNPLGIIALFIVLIYGIAALVFGVSTASLDSSQKWVILWFLVLFPLVVFAGFVWLVANHSGKLYAPSDFRNDHTFVQLNKKIAVIEVRQKAAEVDPRADSDSAFTTLEALLEGRQIEVAKNLAKAFLKVRRYSISLTMFTRISEYVAGSGAMPFLQYRAYSLIGLGEFEKAGTMLNILKRAEYNYLYDFWPRLALAYCAFKLGDRVGFDSALKEAVSYPNAANYLDVAMSLYPELAEYLGHQPQLGQHTLRGETHGTDLRSR